MASEPIEWQIDLCWASKNQFAKFNKKHPDEYASLFSNLEKVMLILKKGNRIGTFSMGFFRSEGEGIYRVGQTAVESAKESRLYVYPDEANRVTYILGIGDKDSQGDDINGAKKYARQIKHQLSQ